MEKNERTCWACQRIIIGDSKLGLCPDCLNKYGSPAAAALALGVIIGGRYLIKNGGNIIKGIANIVKNIKK